MGKFGWTPEVSRVSQRVSQRAKRAKLMFAKLMFDSDWLRNRLTGSTCTTQIWHTQMQDQVWVDTRRMRQQAEAPKRHLLRDQSPVIRLYHCWRVTRVHGKWQWAWLLCNGIFY